MMNGNGAAQPVQAQPQPQTFDGATMIPITFRLDVWNTVLTLIGEAPWKIANPLVNEMHAQIKAALEGSPQQPPASGAPALNRAE